MIWKKVVVERILLHLQQQQCMLQYDVVATVPFFELCSSQAQMSNVGGGDIAAGFGPYTLLLKDSRYRQRLLTKNNYWNTRSMICCINFIY